MAKKIKRLAKILKALSNEHRLALFLEIAERQEKQIECQCLVSDIIKMFKLSAPTISHHVKELVNADLIHTERRGKHLVASINNDTIIEVQQALALVKVE